MRLRAMYKKEADGRIEAMLIVMDRGDYATKNIFSDTCLCPSNEKFELDERDIDYIERICMNQEEAVAWIELQVAALKGLLNKWRKIEITGVTNYEI